MEFDWDSLDSPTVNTEVLIKAIKELKQDLIAMEEKYKDYDERITKLEDS